MRLGGPVFAPHDDPQSWVESVQAEGYRAAFCPLPLDADDDTVRAYADAAARADIVIAEVGAWSNPLSRDAEQARAALAKCQAALSLADRIGARCAVNIVGSLGEKWDGPCAHDLTPEGFDAVVQSVRQIVDAVKPVRSVYALETMPWMYPDSADSYLALMRAIDRPDYVGVHLDPVNLVNCPRRYFHTTELLDECFDKLGHLIRSCHGKDTKLQQKLTVHLDEVRPGLGNLDYARYLQRLSQLPQDAPLMLEHLPAAAEYRAAASYVREVAQREGLTL